MESFKKRQKEMHRLERQRDKATKRLQKKLHRAGAADTTSSPEAPQAPSDGEPAIKPTTAE
jgi:hypothetical protein